MELLYIDPDIIVCIKPSRVLSTDEPGGLPDLLREALGEPKADIRTVHRLDRVVSGVMVLARNAKAAIIVIFFLPYYRKRKHYIYYLHLLEFF